MIYSICHNYICHLVKSRSDKRWNSQKFVLEPHMSISAVISLFLYFYFFFNFRFWGTCAGHAGLLHRCILYPAFLPMLSLPTIPTPCCPSPTLSNAPSVCCSSPWVHVFSLFNAHLWVRTCSVWFSVLVSVCWEWWFPASSMSLQRTWAHAFLFF